MPSKLRAPKGHVAAKDETGRVYFTGYAQLPMCESPLKAGDCKTAHALTTSSFASNGELCGHVRVKSYIPVGSPATPGDEAIFSTNLITQGGNPSLMPDGLHTRFYSLIRQADGAWRVASAGSGP
jgi:hypothetical protein